MDSDSDTLLERLRTGDETSLAELFSRHRERLRRLVHFRLDPRLRGRVDADDLLQEAYLNAAQRVRHFLEKPSMSFFVWLRMIVDQTLVDAHRRHLAAHIRDAGREVHLGARARSHGTSTSMAFRIAGNLTSPSEAAIREETYRQLEEALESMDPTDREVLALRHFEELTNGEVAEVLGIQEKAASIRYVRALRRLKGILSRLPGFSEYGEVRP
jgi:RNA polymerase sigma-70 factor (ECF subfamily)